MKAPFGRIGGKTKIANQIIKMFPAEYDTYVEPFVGAGNVLFRVTDYENKKEVINDLDEDVYLVLNALKTDNKNINDNINRELITKEEYYRDRTSKIPVKILEGFKTGFFADRRRGYNPSKNGKGCKTDYRPYESRLKNTIILNEGFDKVIKEYDSEKTFFYLDPPYESKNNKQNYNHNATPLDVYESLKNIKGKFLLSYNDSENIRTIFKDYKIITIDTKYTHTQNIKLRNKTELLISNY